jgi:hypothetical protein
MTTTNIKKVTSIRLNKNLYSSIQDLAKKENRSFNNFIETLLAEAINFKSPNKETLEAMRSLSEEKKSLKKFTDSSDLFNSLMAD